MTQSTAVPFVADTVRVTLFRLAELSFSRVFVIGSVNCPIASGDCGRGRPSQARPTVGDNLDNLAVVFEITTSFDFIG